MCVCVCVCVLLKAVSLDNFYKKAIFLDGTGFSPPAIRNVFITDDIVIVNWTATNEDDIESLQLNIRSDTYEQTFPVCKELNEAIVKAPLEPASNYTVTLIAFDICGQNYTSYTFNSTSDFELRQCPVTSMSTQCPTCTSMECTKMSEVTQSLTSSMYPVGAPTSSMCPVVTPTKESNTGKDSLVG